MDDWQDATLTNRHLHNRVGKGGRGKGGRSNGAFDVQKIFGTYEIKCPVASKMVKKGDGVGRLEVYNLNELGNAIYGELLLPPIVRGNVILAGSRKTMKIAVRALEAEDDKSETSKSEIEDEAAQRSASNDDNEEESEVSEEDDLKQRRHKEFEKNSFRSPKFWLNWQSEVLLEEKDEARPAKPDSEATSQEVRSTPPEKAERATDTGYLIFSGNNCDKFQGTLSCRQLGWDNVKVSGWKLKSQSARDVQIQWST